jgi:hypothetical protein
LLRYVSVSVVVLAVVLGVVTQTKAGSTALNSMLMRLFRDLSRMKTHRRLHSSPSALVTVLLGQETLLPVSEPDDSTPTFTAEELSFYNRVKDPKVVTNLVDNIKLVQ